MTSRPFDSRDVLQAASAEQQPRGSARAALPVGARAAAAERRRQATAFTEAAVALGAGTLGDAERSQQSTAAAAALVRLGELEATEALAVVLRPDPDYAEVIWTVACYQIGDLVPCAIHDFTDAALAVCSVAACPEASHVASELIASTDRGLRWSALVRSGELVTYHPAAPVSASCSSSAPDLLADALGRWNVRLGIWAEGRGYDELGLDDDIVPRGNEEVPGATAVLAKVLATMRAMDADIRAGDERFEELVSSLGRLERRLASIERLIERRLPVDSAASDEALDRSDAQLQAGDDATRSS